MLLASGCAALPWPGGRYATPAPEVGESGLLDLRGVVHVHTEGSHDSPGTLAQVVAAARASGVHWVALTEHTRPGLLAPGRRVEGVLVLPGYELNSAGGTLLAIGVAPPPPPRLPPAEQVRWIHAAGGAAFVGHLESSRLAVPEAYRKAAPDGIELINLHAAAIDRGWRLLWRLLLLPAPLALRTLLAAPARNLPVWNALPTARGVVGSVDAHQKFRVLGPLGGTIDRYRDLFRLVTTHVWVPDTTAASIVRALREGRSYVALEGFARVDRFRFERAGDSYLIEAPQPARLRLVCDGMEADARDAERALLAAPPAARLCRGEAWLGERLWIASAHVPAGLRAPSGRRPPPSRSALE